MESAFDRIAAESHPATIAPRLGRFMTVGSSNHAGDTPQQPRPPPPSPPVQKRRKRKRRHHERDGDYEHYNPLARCSPSEIRRIMTTWRGPAVQRLTPSQVNQAFTAFKNNTGAALPVGFTRHQAIDLFQRYRRLVHNAASARRSRERNQRHLEALKAELHRVRAARDLCKLSGDSNPNSPASDPASAFQATPGASSALACDETVDGSTAADRPAAPPPPAKSPRLQECQTTVLRVPAILPTGGDPNTSDPELKDPTTTQHRLRVKCMRLRVLWQEAHAEAQTWRRRAMDLDAKLRKMKRDQEDAEQAGGLPPVPPQRPVPPVPEWNPSQLLGETDPTTGEVTGIAKQDPIRLAWELQPRQGFARTPPGSPLPAMQWSVALWPSTSAHA